MSSKSYRLYLISPPVKYHHYGVQKEFAAIMNKRIFNFSVALPLLAAFFPPRYRIRIIDASYQKLPSKVPDLVGLTCFTSNSAQCYAIADHYRALGAKVIIGGAHASFSVEEALGHADSVVVGECETLMADLIADFEAGRLKPRYQAVQPCAFRTSPRPRWDLVDRRNLNIVGVQATRGCPFGCEFCLVEKIFGSGHRHREVADIVAEIKSLPIKRLFFVDDNLTLDKAFAKELLSALEGLGVSWSCQASIEIGRDPALLEAMARAGCMSVLVGFESLDQETLEASHKLQNRSDEYESLIRAIHQAGILVIGSFIVGFEQDSLESFDRIKDFCARNRIVFANVYCLLPTRGTDLAARLAGEGRLIDLHTDFQNANFPSFRHPNFGLVEMYERYVGTMQEMLSLEHGGAKVLALLGSGDLKAAKAGKARFVEKLVGFLRVLAFYPLSGDPGRRRLFREALGHARAGRASMPTTIYLLMVLMGFETYRRNYAAVREEALPVLKALDRAG